MKDLPGKLYGVSGRDRSGKDTVAELLMEHGYFGYSFGDAVRRHAMERHADKPDPISVQNMTETSNWLRSMHGPDVILKEALASYETAIKVGEQYQGIVLFSVRAPIEVDFILEHGGDMVWVETTDEVRFERKIAHMREGETKVTLEEMLAQESLQTKPQAGIPEAVQMNLDYVRSKATITIENNGNDKQLFLNSVQKILGLAG